MMRRADQHRDGATIIRLGAALAAVSVGACASTSDAQPAMEESAWPTASGYAMTVTQRSAVMERLYRRWDAPCDFPHPEDLEVTVLFTLNPDGTLASPPRLRDGAEISASNDSYLRSAAEFAVLAVEHAFEVDGPINFLPPEDYDKWKDVVVNFRADLVCGVR